MATTNCDSTHFDNALGASIETLYQAIDNIYASPTFDGNLEDCALQLQVIPLRVSTWTRAWRIEPPRAIFEPVSPADLQAKAGIHIKRLVDICLVNDHQTEPVVSTQRHKTPMVLIDFSNKADGILIDSIRATLCPRQDSPHASVATTPRVLKNQAEFDTLIASLRNEFENLLYSVEIPESAIIEAYQEFSRKLAHEHPLETIQRLRFAAQRGADTVLVPALEAVIKKKSPASEEAFATAQSTSEYTTQTGGSAFYGHEVSSSYVKNTGSDKLPEGPRSSARYGNFNNTEVQYGNKYTS